jgi:hypothetical protein
MFVVDLDSIDAMLLSEMISIAEKRGEKIQTAYDPIDKSFKVRIGNGVWSRPMGKLNTDH